MKQYNFQMDQWPGFWVYLLHTQEVVALRSVFLGAGFDLTPEQWSVLNRLMEKDGINQNRLAERTVKDRHNINRILNQLEKKGYIERRHDSSDKRVHLIFLTKSGRITNEKLFPKFLDHLHQRFKGIGLEDLDCLRRMLRTMYRNIEGENSKSASRFAKITGHPRWI